MICPECGASNSKSSKTCVNCHVSLKHESYHKNTTKRNDNKRKDTKNKKGRFRDDYDD